MRCLEQRRNPWLKTATGVHESPVNKQKKNTFNPASQMKDVKEGWGSINSRLEEDKHIAPMNEGEERLRRQTCQNNSYYQGLSSSPEKKRISGKKKKRASREVFRGLSTDRRWRSKFKKGTKKVSTNEVVARQSHCGRHPRE